jgi:hypothetical protein
MIGALFCCYNGKIKATSDSHSTCTKQQFMDSSETLSRLFRDSSETLPRLFRDSSETLPRLFRDSSETLPRLFRDKKTEDIFMEQRTSVVQKVIMTFIIVLYFPHAAFAVCLDSLVQQKDFRIVSLL